MDSLPRKTNKVLLRAIIATSAYHLKKNVVVEVGVPTYE
jgi:hypothetical protein